MKPLLILRPQPGATRTASRARALSLNPLLCPLFTVEPLSWTPPDPAGFDALLLTSANAVRHAGSALAVLAGLPVIAVGAATADAARVAGLAVSIVGTSDAGTLLRGLAGPRRLLHLAGEHRGSPPSDHRVEAIAVYRSAPITDPRLPDPRGLVIAVHSPRAGARLAELVEDRGDTAIVAISEAAADASGRGWGAICWPESPDDSALLALAVSLCQGPTR